MISGHPHICLYQPEIPQNTGNIGRLAAATGSRLHLVKPFGFSTSDKNLRRAGLDYWPFLDLEIHDDLESVLKLFPGRFAFFSKKAARPFTAMPDDVELLIFGRETTGLPESLLLEFPENSYNIPMYHPGVRSLNLANAVSVIVYHRILKKRGLI
jgi:tRNA (cytidine/uridine-2'-O-)-methyltransferase